MPNLVKGKDYRIEYELFAWVVTPFKEGWIDFLSFGIKICNVKQFKASV